MKAGRQLLAPLWLTGMLSLPHRFHPCPLYPRLSLLTGVQALDVRAHDVHVMST